MPLGSTLPGAVEFELAVANLPVLERTQVIVAHLATKSRHLPQYLRNSAAAALLRGNQTFRKVTKQVD